MRIDPKAQPVAEMMDRLRADRHELAGVLTDEYFHDHPEFEAAHPPHARLRTREDFGYLVDFLVGALAAGDPTTFVDMVLWTASVLESRNVPRAVLADSLGRLERAVAERYPLAISESAVDILGIGARSLVAHQHPAIGDPRRLAPDLDQSARVFLQAILQGDRHAALGVATEALTGGTSVADVYVTIIQMSMYEVGRRWEANEITVADEHLATAITQWVLAQLYDRLNIPAPHRGRAVITGIEGELHQLGANMVADMLEADGWDVRFLGANTPHEAVLNSVADHRATVLGVSTTMVVNLPQVDRLVSDARERFGDGLRVIVGGGAFRGDPDLAKRFGVDGFAPDLRSAVQTLRTIT